MDAIGNDTTVEPDAYLDAYQMLTKTFLLLDDSDRRFFAEYGLSTRQFLALQHLDEQQGCSMVDLSRVLLTDKSNVTGIVDRLEQLHLVRRQRDPHDRRILQITLTEDGLCLRDTVRAQHHERLNQLMSILSQTELRSLRDNLRVLSHTLETYLEQHETPHNDLQDL